MEARPLSLEKKMANRSRVHMLTVAAARLEQTLSNPKLVADLKAAAEAEAERKAEGVYGDDETKRIGRQRNRFTMLPQSVAKDRLQEEMLQRVYDLMWDGDTSGADALAEFLPSKEVGAVFDAWENDQLSTAEKSRWYGS